MAEKTTAGAAIRSMKRDAPVPVHLWEDLVVAMATMLLVARPLVLGEDPGLLVDRLSDASGLTLTLLWLILGAIWTVRQWAKEAKIALDRLDLTMLGLVAVIAVSARHASYLHPARLIAWEWLVFWIVLVVIRRLARDERTRRCLLAATLATGASISAYACYQTAVELPALRRQVQERSGTVMEELGREGISLDSDDPMLEAWRQRVMAGHAFGTFAHPNTFAGYLALLVPPACACAVFGFRQRRRKRWVMAMMSLLLATALALTHSRGAILGVGLAAVLLACAGWNRLRARTALAWTIPAVLASAFAAAWLAAPSRALDLARRSMGLRLDYWSATTRMMTDPAHTDRLLFGVGPGMFGRFYPRYMNWQATEKISDPHNFILELWATSGSLAAILIILLVAIALARCWSGAYSQQGRRPGLEGADNLPTPRFFIYGGMAGFVLAFTLTAVNQDPDALVGNAWMALARMLIWAIAFFAFASDAYPSRLLSISLGAGVVACLINCLVSGGISFPALAQCLCAAIALAFPASIILRLNGRASMRWLLPATVGAILVLYYIGAVYWPVMQASRYSNQARDAMAAMTGNRSRAGILSTRVIPPLEQAVNADPSDASCWVSLADGYAMLWRQDRAKDALSKALDSARKATNIDPEGKEGYLAEFRIAQSRAGTEDGRMAETAVAAMRQVIERDPSEAKWHYLLSEALWRSGRNIEAREEAQKTQELDKLAGSGPRRLTNRQREQLQKWLRETR